MTPTGATEGDLPCLPYEVDRGEAKYSIDSIKAFGGARCGRPSSGSRPSSTRSSKRKKAGRAEDVIKQAQDQHLRAHILWEYWTAENSDGFHNPEMARESLTKSVDESQKGIKIIADALDPPVPAPAAAPAK